MKLRAAIAVFIAAAVLLAAGAGGIVSRGEIGAVEKVVNKRLEQLSPGEPFLLLGLAQGVYLQGYGAVFMARVNLAEGPGLTPFRPAISDQERARLHKMKQERLPTLRAAMKELMISSAGMMDNVPAEEQMVLGVSLFYHPWEDTSGLPAQIVMQSARKNLVEFQTGRRDRSTIEQVLRIQEF